MGAGSTTTARAAAGGRRRIPFPMTAWWVRVLAIWLASRVVTTGIMLVLAAHEGRTFWAPARPGYLMLAQFWDSGWYHTIATVGYPARLPLDAMDHVLPNAWAFLPAYPAVTDALSTVTRLPWDVASVLVAALCSLGAALVLDRLLRALDRSSTFAVALFCFGPLSPLLQVAYADSMAMMLLLACLLLLVRRRYVALSPLLLVTGLTRPLAVPLAAAVAVHVALRLRRSADPPLRGRLRIAALGALAAAAIGAVLWPAIAWMVTGDSSAYVASELAWRRSGPAPASLVPFAPWVQAAGRLAPGAPGQLLLVVGVAAFAALLVAVPSVRRLGSDVRIWAAVYGLYLLAVFDPQSSTIRLLLPLAPLLGALASVRSRWVRAALIGIGVAGQVLWFAATWTRWHIAGWSPP